MSIGQKTGINIMEGVTTTMPNNTLATVGTNNTPVVAGNEFELSTLESHQSAVITATRGNFEFALIERKEKSTRITLWDDVDSLEQLVDNRSAVISALTSEDKPTTFSLNNKLLDSLIDKAELVFTDLIDLLSGYPELEKEDLTALLKKINQLSKVYAPEFIISQLQDFTANNLHDLIETESTLRFFRSFFSIEDEEFED